MNLLRKYFPPNELIFEASFLDQFLLIYFFIYILGTHENCLMNSSGEKMKKEGGKLKAEKGNKKGSYFFSSHYFHIYCIPPSLLELAALFKHAKGVEVNCKKICSTVVKIYFQKDKIMTHANTN